MAGSKRPSVDYRRVELDGVHYVIVREAVFQRLCAKAGIDQRSASSKPEVLPATLDLDRGTLAQKLIHRRQAAGLSQVALASRAGIRPETLNRIERGRTTPDFATVRKLVVAMNAAELEHVAV